MNFQPLQYIYKPSDRKDAYTLLLLHGTGGNEEDLLPIAGYFGNDLNILSLRGNVSEHGMPRFFKRLGMGIFDEDDLRFRSHELTDFVAKLAAEKGFDAGKIVALGYSNGANIAGSILLLQPDFFKGAILYRPMQPYKQMPETGGRHAVPVFMSNGLQDPTIAPADTEHYVQLMKDAGFGIEHHQLETGHNLSQEDLRLSIQWFQKNFGDGAV